MKYLNRWFYALVGVIVLLLAGLIYAWSTMSKSIGAYTGWNAAQLSTAFTLAMVFFCIGCLIAGIYARRVHPKHYVRLSGILFLAGFMLVGFFGGGRVCRFFTLDSVFLAAWEPGLHTMRL